jgi:hypothetical protein
LENVLKVEQLSHEPPRLTVIFRDVHTHSKLCENAKTKNLKGESEACIYYPILPLVVIFHMLVTTKFKNQIG